MTAPLLHLRDVIGARRGGFTVEIPALDVCAGDALAIIGRSGSGKSTILDVLAGILAPAEAGACVASADGRRYDIAACWRAGDQDGLRAYRSAMLGYVLQTGGLVPFLSLADNVALPYWRDGRRPTAEAAAILSELEIAEEAAKLPRHVSVGQRQRAAIARAVAGNPRLILADEPTAALDVDTADAVMTLLTGAARRRGLGLVVVTHDVALAEAHGLTTLTVERVAERRSRLAPHVEAAAS